MCYFAALSNCVISTTLELFRVSFRVGEDNSDINMLRYASHPSPSGVC